MNSICLSAEGRGDILSSVQANDIVLNLSTNEMDHEIAKDSDSDSESQSSLCDRGDNNIESSGDLDRDATAVHEGLVNECVRSGLM